MRKKGVALLKDIRLGACRFGAVLVCRVCALPFIAAYTVLTPVLRLSFPTFEMKGFA